MARRLSFVGLLVALVAALLVIPRMPRADAQEVVFRKITFPVAGASTRAYSDDFGDARSGGRRHKGNDIFGVKGQHLISAADGRVTWLKIEDGQGLSGNGLTITDAQGWSYLYVHINNDTPGTDDGTNPLNHAFAPGIHEGATVRAGQHVAFLGDSGNAEGTRPHLHFEIRRPDGTSVNPYPSLRISQGQRVGNQCRFDVNPPLRPSPASAPGYWALGTDGGVFTFGGAAFHGSMGGRPLNRPVMAMAATPSGDGYWQVASDGGIFAFGDAGFFGSTGGIVLNRPIVGMAPTASGRGYWLVASDGGIFAFGDAGFFGSTGGIVLNRPIVGMAPTASGRGYWLVASDGGMFAFGDAAFSGSTADRQLAAPIVGMAATPSGGGYWLLGGDGAVFFFGDAPFLGDLPAAGWCTWPRAVRLVPSATGRGYWLQGADGSTWAFGDAWHHGSVAGLGLPSRPGTIDLVAVPTP